MLYYVFCLLMHISVWLCLVLFILIFIAVQTSMVISVIIFNFLAKNYCCSNIELSIAVRIMILYY
jgi:hypothetical protein